MLDASLGATSVAAIAPSVTPRRLLPHTPAGLPPGYPLAEFRHRFGALKQGSPDGQAQDQLAPDQKGVGTGFVISASGDIVTNNHVVELADSVTVKLADGTGLVPKWWAPIP